MSKRTDSERDTYLDEVGATLSEWNSLEDTEAYKGLNTSHVLTIRDARPGEIETILDLARGGAVDPGQVPPADLSNPAYRIAFDAIAADPNQRLVVAEQDGDLVATLHLMCLPGLLYQGGWRGQLESVHVRADKRGQGLGAELVTWAVEECRRRGCKLVQLSSNKQRKDAHHFYEKLGFQRSHEGFKYYL